MGRPYFIITPLTIPLAEVAQLTLVLSVPLSGERRCPSSKHRSPNFLVGGKDDALPPAQAEGVDGKRDLGEAPGLWSGESGQLAAACSKSSQFSPKVSPAAKYCPSPRGFTQWQGGFKKKEPQDVCVRDHFYLERYIQLTPMENEGCI